MVMDGVGGRLRECRGLKGGRMQIFNLHISSYVQNVYVYMHILYTFYIRLSPPRASCMIDTGELSPMSHISATLSSTCSYPLSMSDFIPVIDSYI